MTCCHTTARAHRMESAMLVLMFTIGTLSGQALSCGLNITGSGNISSPNFPNNYGYSSYCVWKLRADSGGRLRLEFLALNLEAGQDFLVAYRGDPSNDSTANVYFRYSGSTPPNPVVLGENATLVFTSDDSVDYSGFFILVKTVSANEANESTAQEAMERCLAQSKFFCSRSQECVATVTLCNGWRDCALGEDEANCATNSETTSFPMAANITDVAVSAVIYSTPKTVCADQRAYLCGKSSECIHASARCNGHADCMYGDDEEACNVTTSTTQPGHSIGGPLDAAQSTAVGSDGSQERRTTSYASSGQTTVNDISAYAPASSEVSSDLASTLRTSIGMDSQTYAPITANLTADLHIYSSKLLTQSAATNIGKETTRKTLSIAMTTTRVAFQATTSSFQSGETSGKEPATCLSSVDYWCDRSRQCVPVEARCNGTLDCTLGDDEAGCPTGVTPQTVNQLKTAQSMLKLDISVLSSAAAAVRLRGPSHFVKEIISLWMLTTMLW